jgi:hypothetical protein
VLGPWASYGEELVTSLRGVVCGETFLFCADGVLRMVMEQVSDLS